MGVITRLYHRSEGLADNRYNVFFLDMGENIHIHYRDLRIELSADEFTEFADLIETYLPQIRAELAGGYRDGVRPNTNQTSTLTTISSKRPLKYAIKYNPNRISIEENLDGYHIHLRNYKLLLDKPSFFNFVRAAKDVVDKRDAIVDLDETLSLIAINDLEHQVGERSIEEGREQVMVTVEKPYFKKTQQLLEGLKYASVDQTGDAVVYEKGRDRIYLRIGQLPRSAQLATVTSSLVPFADYVRKNATRFTPEEFNLLQLQYLDKYLYVRKNQLGHLVELDHRRLIYDTASGSLIFPTRTGDAAADPAAEHERLAVFLREQGLSFVKPGKIPYSEAEDGRLQAVFDAYVKGYLAKQPCVAKVYLLNAASKKRRGRYQVPFVHFDWAKLGSDFDLYIEVDERYPVPGEWDYKFFWSACSADYYHLGDVDFPITSEYIARFPNIPFRHHLVEAYLFFPAKGNRATKDEYLKKFNAALLYQKGDDRPKVETDELLRDFLPRAYAIDVRDVNRMDVPSFNEMFGVRTGGAEFVAKIMKRGDFTPAAPGHSGHHLDYEARLLGALAGKGAPVVAPVPGRDGSLLQVFDNRYCMLFPFMVSDPEDEQPDRMVGAAARALARVHGAAAAIDVATDWYRFREALDYWIEQYVALHAKFGESDGHAAEYAALIPGLKAAGARLMEAGDLTWLHVHGDVCPRNFFYFAGEAHLFDFQVAHHGPRLEDVAEGALEFALRGDTIDPAQVRQFIAAYESQAALGAAERAALPTMLFLQAAFKLARAFRVQTLFGYKVDKRRPAAFLAYARGCLEPPAQADAPPGQEAVAQAEG